MKDSVASQMKPPGEEETDSSLATFPEFKLIDVQVKCSHLLSLKLPMSDDS